MEHLSGSTKSTAEMLSQALVEIVDNNAHLLTILDLQARIIATLEARDHNDVVDEINEMLKQRRRDALREINQWATGKPASPFDTES